MKRLLAFALLAVPAFAASAAPPADIAPEEMERRGVLFYAPFEGTAEAAVAGGEATPWLGRALEFRPGKVGQAVFVTNKLGQHGSSMLAYEAVGNINRRRGTIAFWVKTPWDGRDRDILTGSAYSGPYILGIASDTGDNFFYFWRRKTFFDVNFHGRYLGGDQMRLMRRWGRELFGEFSGPLIRLWEKDVWQHFAVTWDDRRGWEIYFNGELVQSFEGDIEWDLNKPDTIALGHRPLRSRDVWPVTSDFWFDEFLIFMRPLEAGEIRSVMDADYAALRPVRPEDWAFDEDARRRSVQLEPNDARPVAETRDGAARFALRQVAVEDVEMNFFGGFKLADGDLSSGVTFRDGGLDFDTPTRFRFSQPSRVDLVVADASDPRGAYVFGDVPDEPLAALQAGRNYLRLEGLEQRKSVGVFFPGGSSAQEFAFFSMAPAGDGGDGTAHMGGTPMLRAGGDGTHMGGTPMLRIHGVLPPEEYGDAGAVLLREAGHPRDRAVLSVGGEYPGPETPETVEREEREDGRPRRSVALQPDTLAREKLAHTFFVLEPAERHTFVDSLRLNLRVRAEGPFSAALRIFDSQIPLHVNYHATFAVENAEAGQWTDLDIAAGTAGLIVPVGGRLVLSLTADEALEVALDGSGGIALGEGDAGRIGREFARAQLRQLWPGYLRRINQNRFIRPGETKETSHLYQGLRRALKYDPENEMALSWLYWGRFEAWPEYDFGPLEEAPGPRWAKYLREAALSKQAVIHWWLDHRSNQDGYLAGPGDQWNDITKLYNKYLSLGALVSDERLTDAIERYLDAHWNTGRMVEGYIWYMTDMVHSCEEASYIQPSLHVLRPGVPRHVYRDLRTAANLRQWLGVNERGQTLFRSNQFNALQMDTEGVFGRDKADGDSATVPAKFLHWYSGHPQCGQWILDLADSWLEATLRGEEDKKPGAIPFSIDFETGRPYPGRSYFSVVAERFLNAYQFSGERRYLEPLELLMEKGEEVSHHVSPLSTHAGNFLSHLILTEAQELPPKLRQDSKERVEALSRDHFFQRGVEAAETRPLLLWAVERDEDALFEALKYVIRNNRRSFPVYCHTEPPTDRVYPWGRAVLPVAMLGGRLFDGRAANPVPTAAFAWRGTDTDVVSLVTERRRGGLAMLVHNFKDAPVQAGIRALDLPEGRYRMAVAPYDDEARRAVGTPRSGEIALRRFTATPLELPPQRTIRVELTLLEERPRQPRPDLAVTLAKGIGEDGSVTARVHNLGALGVERTEVRLVLNGRVLDRATVENLPALDGFEPQFADVVLRAPAGADLSDALLVVDPDGEIDEINESNNAYPLRLGVPPPVETQKPPYSGRDGVVEVRW